MLAEHLGAGFDLALDLHQLNASGPALTFVLTFIGFSSRSLGLGSGSGTDADRGAGFDLGLDLEATLLALGRGLHQRLHSIGEELHRNSPCLRLQIK